MISKSQFLVPLFEKFISDSQKGKRIKPDGSRIKLQTIINYDYTLKYLKEFEEFKDQKLEIKLGKAKKISYSKQQPKEWLKFYNSFSDFLFKQKGFYDNYVGSIVKNIKAFFNYLKKDMGFDIGDHYKKFYVRKENIPILALQPNQLKFLISDVSFHESLPKTIQKSKDVFVFGCTVALRVSDIFALKSTNIEYTGNGCYLRVKTKKTGKEVCLKLPDYAVTILQEFLSKGKGRKSIFPNIPLSRFNNHIKIIADPVKFCRNLHF